jgi:hypothetical protein
MWEVLQDVRNVCNRRGDELLSIFGLNQSISKSNCLRQPSQRLGLAGKGKPFSAAL